MDLAFDGIAANGGRVAGSGNTCAIACKPRSADSLAATSIGQVSSAAGITSDNSTYPARFIKSDVCQKGEWPMGQSRSKRNPGPACPKIRYGFDQLRYARQVHALSSD